MIVPSCLRRLLPWRITPALLLSASCSPQAPPAQSAGRSAPVAVVTAPAVRKTVPLLLPAIGSVQPRATVTVRPQVSGKLAEVHFREGDFVKQGDLLFTVDPRPFEIALAQAKAALEQAKAEAANATVREQRYSKLDEGGGISAELVEQIRTASFTALSKVTVAGAAVEQSRLELDYCRISAPLTGRAGRLLLDPGNILQANLTDLAIINEIQPIEVSFTLAGRHLPALRQFSTSGGTPLEVAVTPEGSPSLVETGTVAFFDNTVRAASGTIEVRALFPNEKQILWPGQFTDVRLRLTETKDALTVPAKSVQTGQAGPYVYVIGSNRTAELRQLKIDRIFESTALVLEGLKEGDEVVTEGQHLLRAGALVDVKNNPAPLPSAAATPVTSTRP
ncbi:MAG: efflux RND transporter periplasmic adaptor subunit [Verrucomicrobiota bacterium]